jgi:hypothetical protein
MSLLYCSVINGKSATQHSVQPTWGTRRVIWAFFVALSFFRFDGESMLPPQAGNANR